MTVSKKDALRVLEAIAMDIPIQLEKQLSEDGESFEDSDIIINIELLDDMIQQGIK